MGEAIGKIIVALMAFIGIFALVAICGLVWAFPIKWCWNYAVSPIFDLSPITWGQAYCLNLIAHSFIKASQTNNNK